MDKKGKLNEYGWEWYELNEYGWEVWTERIWMKRINWTNMDEKGKLNEYMNVKNEMN